LLHLYFMPGTCSLATHIALEEVGTDYEATVVDFRTEAQREPEFLKLNPKGRVPALATDKGILTESPAILTYIGSAFPDAGLLPTDDPFLVGSIQSLNAYLCATLHVAHAHRFRGYRWADSQMAIDELKRKSTEVISECFEMVENDLFKGPWATGETYTISDPYLFTFTLWMESDDVDISKVPKLVAYRERMKERPAVQRALAKQKL
jgi:glutathione S-transferase